MIATAPAVAAVPLSIFQVNDLAGHCARNVAPATLLAIAKTESGFKPFTINDNTGGTSGSVDSIDQAVAIASSLIADGHSVDLGLMQINSANLGPLGLTVSQAFDPCRSMEAAGRVLAADYSGGDTHDDQQAALRQAISRYNTGNPVDGFQNGYVRKVELAARTVPALDVGSVVASPPPAMAMAPSVAPADPNAPPIWDVWTSYDYAAAHKDAPAVVTGDAAETASVSHATSTATIVRDHD